MQVTCNTLRKSDLQAQAPKWLNMMAGTSTAEVRCKPTFTDEEVVRGALQQTVKQPGLQRRQQRLHALVQDL